MAIPTTSTSPAFTTYDLTTGIKLDIEDAIYLISPFDVPLQGALGADGRISLAQATCFEKKVEWLDETLLTPRTTQSATTALATTNGTTLYSAAGAQLQFQTGDIILMDGEYMQITGYVSTTGWNVARGGTTNANNLGTVVLSTSAANDVIIGVGSALPEGSNPPAARAVDRTDRFNLTQVFGPYGVSVSQSEQAVQKYGLRSTEFDHQVMNRTKEAFIAIEQAILYGLLSASAGGSDSPLNRTMAGLTSFITTNVDSTSTQITDATLLPNLENCFDAGGTPDRIVLSSYQKRQLSQLNSGDIRYPQELNVRGQVADYYESDFGRISVVLDRWCRKADLFIFSRDQAELNTLRPLSFEMLAKTGDAINGQVVGEKTLKFRRQSWAALMTALT
jgi:hypothetical protein